MPAYQQDSHLRERETDTQKLMAALTGWTRGIEALETGSITDDLDSYRIALGCRDVLGAAGTTADFKQRKNLATRLPELDRRFKAATVPVEGCLHEALTCDPKVGWWYYRAPASHPDWPAEPTA